MNLPNLMRCAAIVATVGVGCAVAQTSSPSAPSTTMPATPSTVTTTDVGPPPAEDRDSTGAIVLQNSLVRAQRDSAFQRSAAQTGVTTVGRGVVRSTMRAKTQSDLAQAREEESVNLNVRGAASLTGK